MRLSLRERLSRLLRRLDTRFYIAMGWIPDVKNLDFVYERRKLFTFDGLIKTHLSLVPFVEYKLKLTVLELGGWESVMDPERTFTENEIEKLEQAGLNKTQVELSRLYLSDPIKYLKESRVRNS